MEEPFWTRGVYLKLQVEHLIEKSALTDVRVSDAQQISSCSRPRLEVVITQLMVGLITVYGPLKLSCGLIVLNKHERVDRILQIFVKHQILDCFWTDLYQIVKWHFLRCAVPKFLLDTVISMVVWSDHVLHVTRVLKHHIDVCSDFFVIRIARFGVFPVRLIHTCALLAVDSLALLPIVLIF